MSFCFPKASSKPDYPRTHPQLIQILDPSFYPFRFLLEWKLQKISSSLTSSPRLGRGLVTGLLADGVRLPLVLGHSGVDVLDDVGTDGGAEDLGKDLSGAGGLAIGADDGYGRSRGHCVERSGLWLIEKKRYVSISIDFVLTVGFRREMTYGKTGLGGSLPRGIGRRTGVVEDAKISKSAKLRSAKFWIFRVESVFVGSVRVDPSGPNLR